MLCQICERPRANVRPKKSSLLDTTLLACDVCINNKYEPRAYIILVGRSKGPVAVRDFIVNHRYLGTEITAAELTV